MRMNLVIGYVACVQRKLVRNYDVKLIEEENIENIDKV